VIDWLIIYGILMGALRLLLNHHQPVEPGGTSSYTAKGLFGLWVRWMLIAFIIIQGFHLYWIYPYVYSDWWNAYFVEHSPMAFVLVTLPITLGLYLAKFISFWQLKNPSGLPAYGPASGGHIPLHTCMRKPLLWYLAFWGWLLFSPWLPFYKCFVLCYLLQQKSWVVFPMFWTL